MADTVNRDSGADANPAPGFSCELPEPCAPGRHHPAIVHRTRRGGDDSAVRNVCGVCGRQIKNPDEGRPYWVTEQQADEYAAEMAEENRREMEEQWEEALHPEWRCPPRE